MVKFSILIPTFKRNIFLKRAINSILLQKAKISEIIVIDDFGDENCEKLTRDFNKLNKIKIIYKKNKSHNGEYFAKNWAMKFIKGNYIAFLDDDDFWGKNYLKNANKYILRENSDILLTNYFNFYNPKKIKNGKKIPKKFKLENFLVHNHGALQSNVIIKTDVFKKINGFDTRIPCADKDLFVRVNLKNYKYTHITEREVFYQLHDGNYSQNYKKLIKSKLVFYLKYINYYFKNFQIHYSFLKFLIFLFYKGLKTNFKSK